MKTAPPSPQSETHAALPDYQARGDENEGTSNKGRWRSFAAAFYERKINLTYIDD